MKLLIPGILCLFVFAEGISQNHILEWEPCTSCTAIYPTYQTAVQMNPFHVTEDFGRRETGSRWHNGLDINGEFGAGELGYHITSVVAGTITKIYRTGYKVILIDGADNLDFAYGHIFMDSDGPLYRLGDMVLGTLTSHPNYSVIIYDPSNVGNAYCLTDAPLTGGTGDAVYSMSYTRADGTLLTFTTTGTNRLTNLVNAGDIIAPMGGSGGFEGTPGQGSPHLHLYNFSGIGSDISNFQRADNLKNPLNFLSYIQPTAITSTVEGITRSDNGATPLAGIGPFYGGIDVKTRTLFHPQKQPGSNRYTPTSPIFDINKVELLIKKRNSAGPYELLKGAHFESKIDYGGRWTAPGNVRYPSLNNPVGNTVGGDNTGINPSTSVDIAQTKTGLTYSAGYGDYRKTGIFGNAYTDYLPANSYDEFYFNDYQTRIHVNDNFGKLTPQLAFRSSDARYPDDSYELAVRTHTVRNVIFEPTSSREIVIDNFQPFVQKVEGIIYYDYPFNKMVGYSKEWIYNAPTNSQTLSNDQALVDIYEGQPLTIKVETSEPMLSMKISIPTLGIVDLYMTSETNLATWIFRIPTANNASGSHQIIFSGTDYAGNNLVNVPEEIPYRDVNGTWVNGSSIVGQDENHTIFIEPGDCSNSGGRIVGNCDIIADFTHNSSMSNPLLVSFTDASVPPANITSWSWNFGDPVTGSQNSSTLRNPNHLFSSNGTYVVTLTSSYGVTTDSHAKQIIVDNTPVSVNFEMTRSIGNVPFTVDLMGSTTLSNVVTWEWIVDPGTSQMFSPNKYSQNASLTLFATGSYTVKLRVSNGSSVFVSQPQTIVVNQENAPIPDFSWSEPVSIYTLIEFDDNSLFGCFEGGAATASWSITDPFGYVTGGETSAGLPYSYYPIQLGMHNIQLCVTDGCGAMVCVSKSMNVGMPSSTIQADFSTSALTIKRGETIEFRDLTSNFQNFEGRGWWFAHVPGTSWGVANNFDYRDYPPSYSGILTHKYNTAGTFEARLSVYPNLQFPPSSSKTVTIQVEDNLMEEIQQYPHWNDDIAGDYFVTTKSVSSNRKIIVSKRNGNEWNQIAQLGNNLDGGVVLINDSFIAYKTLNSISIFEKPMGEWVDNSLPTTLVSTSGNIVNYGFAINDHSIATITKIGPSGTKYVELYSKSGEKYQSIIRPEIDPVDIAFDNETLVVKHSKSINENCLAIFETQPLSLGYVYADKICGNSHFAKTVGSYGEINESLGFDISGKVIVVVNHHWSSTPKVAYLYERGTNDWPDTPNATLSFEFNSFGTGITSGVRVDNNSILVSMGEQIVVYRKPYDGWKSMKETIRLKGSNLSSTAWPMESSGYSYRSLSLDGNYLSVGYSSVVGKYIFEIEPVLCDDEETLPPFNITNGQSISNHKGLVTIGGNGTSVVDIGGRGDFRGVQVVVKDGFVAKRGSTVTIKSTTCEDF